MNVSGGTNSGRCDDVLLAYPGPHADVLKSSDRLAEAGSFADADLP